MPECEVIVQREGIRGPSVLADAVLASPPLAPLAKSSETVLAGELRRSLVIDHGVGAVLELAIEVEGSAEPQFGVDEFDFRTEDLADVIVQERPDSRRVRLDLRLHRLPPCHLLCRPVQLRTELCGAS